MTAEARRNNLHPRILLAPCGFKENLSVAELIESMARGVKAAAPDAEILRAPMADGGEGFAQTLAQLTGGCLHPVQVTGPVGQPLQAHLGLLGGAHVGTVAIEIAAAAGLRHVPVGQRDPLRTTSYGVGELVREALDLGAQRLLIGCGDSGVNDGGAGLAQALGIRLSDRRGRAIGRGCGALDGLAHIDLSGRDPRLGDVSIDVAVNWDNVLLGRRGVSRVFGPQKGASPKDLAALETGLRTLAAVIRRDLAIDVRTMQGGGASGGLGAGLHAFLGARLCPRFAILSRFLDFDALLERADLVLTAEGRIDGLTSFGKLPAEVARRAKQAGIPVVAIVGSVGHGANTMHEIGIDAYFSIVDGPGTMADAMSRAPELVASATEQVVRLALLDCQSTRKRKRE
ncbi:MULTISPECIES: glycerate kinase [Diaphorobacter]|uniref:Glycerate kinase n=1 Tax=Acidovorax ebreus (strain TPSY) TaxID=535289 RepID=A0A9J9UB38_ACIET|nr:MULTISPECIES: glycerate kinase [Diaphorobacter]ACM33595.1 glycerate kinase [[Acidovorax] ebreus TPSY]